MEHIKSEMFEPKSSFGKTSKTDLICYEEYNSIIKLEMFSNTINWLDDWIEYNSPEQLIDSYDIEQWMNGEMIDVIDLYLDCSYKKVRTKEDCKDVIRALMYEYAKFRQSIALDIIRQRSEKDKSKIVKRILELPQTAQKTKEWKLESLNLLTGHEFADVVYGSEKMREAIIIKKCSPLIETSEQTCYITPVDGKLSPFKWGWRYEPVVKSIFEKYYVKGKINDNIGRIRHSSLPRLAASPDGLIISGPNTGHLVEIKSPISRELDNKIPLNYWCQMQLQAEVCDIDIVEYVEIRFETVPINKDVEVWLKKPFKDNIPKMFGVICVVGKEGDYNSNRYVYSEPFESIKDFMEYKPKYEKDEKIYELCAYRVLDYHHTSVLRNKIWWETVGKPAYEEFWTDVDELKKSGKSFKKEEVLFLDE